jgi:hypothetical protein
MIKVIVPWTTHFNGTIVDFESTHFDAKQGELITAGFLSGKGFTIIQRVNLNELDFKNNITQEMASLKEPLFAYKKECEEGFCGKSITYDLQNEREAAFVALKNEGLLEHYNSLCDPLFNEEIPRFWKLWKETGNPLLLSKIMRHNYCCLAKEYYLKLKRIDKIEPDGIIPFISSAAIEKRYFRPALGFDLV